MRRYKIETNLRERRRRRRRRRRGRKSRLDRATARLLLLYLDLVAVTRGDVVRRWEEVYEEEESWWSVWEVARSGAVGRSVGR
jgi:hypothetical protein